MAHTHTLSLSLSVLPWCCFSKAPSVVFVASAFFFSVLYTQLTLMQHQKKHEMLNWGPSFGGGFSERERGGSTSRIRAPLWPAAVAFADVAMQSAAPRTASFAYFPPHSASPSGPQAAAVPSGYRWSWRSTDREHLTNWSGWARTLDSPRTGIPFGQQRWRCCNFGNECCRHPRGMWELCSTYGRQLG